MNEEIIANYTSIKEGLKKKSAEVGERIKSLTTSLYAEKNLYDSQAKQLDKMITELSGKKVAGVRRGGRQKKPPVS